MDSITESLEESMGETSSRKLVGIISWKGGKSTMYLCAVEWVGNYLVECNVQRELRQKIEST